MTIHEVNVEYGRTVNLGNYESERVHVGLVAMVGGEEDHRVAARELLLEARRLTDEELVALAERRQRERYPTRYPSKPAVDEEDDPERPF